MRKSERLEIAKIARGRDAAPMEDPTARALLGPYADRDTVLSQHTVWYRLMKLTNLINRPFFARHAGRYHLTINDARVLVALASMSEGAAHELCAATGMHCRGAAGPCAARSCPI